MKANDKNQQTQEAAPLPEQPVAGSPADLDKRAENDNPRANENLPRDGNENGDTTFDVGSEITDGEDA